jgi:hypothetical protein
VQRGEASECRECDRNTQPSRRTNTAAWIDRAADCRASHRTETEAMGGASGAINNLGKKAGGVRATVPTKHLSCFPKAG